MRTITTITTFVAVSLYALGFDASANDGWTYFQALQSNWASLEEFDVLISDERFEPKPKIAIETKCVFRMICSYKENKLIFLASSERIATDDNGASINGKHMSVTCVNGDQVIEYSHLNRKREPYILDGKLTMNHYGFPEIRMIGLDSDVGYRMQSFESVDKKFEQAVILARVADDNILTARTTKVICDRGYSVVAPNTELALRFEYEFSHSNSMPISISTTQFVRTNGRDVKSIPNSSARISWQLLPIGVAVPQQIVQTARKVAYDEMQKAEGEYQEQVTRTFKWITVNKPIDSRFWDSTYWENLEAFSRATKFPLTDTKSE